MPLEEYNAKRDFARTSEPKGGRASKRGQAIFVIQEHHASTLHYDFRLEADGVLKSWAVPKQPTLDPAQKRLAVQVEDHPLDYATFAGTIPEGSYGAGTVSIWDHGTFENVLAEKPTPQTVTEAIDAGHVEVALHGEKLRGKFALIRMKGRGRGKPQWLLIKMKDEFAEAANGRTSGNHKSKTRTSTKSAPRVKKARSKQPSHEVVVTHPEKVFFPDAGLTKGDIFEYYDRIADRLLPYLKDRPATLERLPDGLAGPDAPHFWQKNTPAYYPDWIPRIEIPTEAGKPVEYALVNDKPTLLYLVNQGVLTFHIWSSRVSDLDRPDFVLFDLDPGRAAFADVVRVAKEIHATLKGEGAEAFVKTSGKSGLHILVPWNGKGGYDDAREWARSLAQRVAKANPELATTEVRKANRGRRVYIDVLQNARGHHAVPPYVVRTMPGAMVSTPLEWKEVTSRLDPSAFTVTSIFRRLARRKADPMAKLLRSFSRNATAGSAR